MGLFTPKLAVQGLKADINPAPKATLKRKVERYKRCLDAQKRAVKRGDVRKAALLEAEIEALAGNLLEERAAINEMLEAQ